MSSKRRRPSRATAKGQRAYCPFTLRIDTNPVAPRETAEASQPSHYMHQPAKKKKKSTTSKLPIQVSPFEPVGHFRTHATIDVHYDITPREKWTDIKRRHGCRWKDKTYLNDDFVFVANDRSAAHGKLGKDLNALVGSRRLWVARVLEIRVADKYSVYARVCWMYSPDELPTGRQPYHGKNELIASNHLDIINVFSIIGHAQVSQWVEAEGRERLEALYWRQAIDCRTEELSAVDLVCRCSTPDNPDKTLVGCTSSHCGKWMHFDCLREDVLKRVYDRVGIDSPHLLAVDRNKNATEADAEQCAAQVLVSTPSTTIRDRLAGRVARRDCTANSKKLTNSEEEAIVKFILQLYSQGLPPRYKNVEDMANLLLSERGDKHVGVRWEKNLVQRSPELTTRFKRRYDYQRAKCEDTKIIRGWFTPLKNIIEKYGMVVTSSDRSGKAKAVQPGNREWASVIQGVNAQGWTIPPYIVVKGENHIAAWYEDTRLPADWRNDGRVEVVHQAVVTRCLKDVLGFAFFSDDRG